MTRLAIAAFSALIVVGFSSVSFADSSLNYQDLAAVNVAINSGIKRALVEVGVSNEARDSRFESGSDNLIVSITQSILVQLDQAGFQLVEK